LTTLEAHERIHETLREALRAYMRPPEIIKVYHIARSTLYEHLSHIRQEDSKWLDELARESFVSSYRLALETLEDQIRYLKTLRAQTQRDDVKLNATVEIRSTELEIINLMAEGPTVYALKRKAEKKVLENTEGVANSA